MSKQHDQPQRSRRVLFRLLTVLLGLSPLLLLETALMLVSWTPPVDQEYRSFKVTDPLFVLDSPRQEFAIDPQRERFFRPASFSASKPANEFRVFVIGGSTVQGRPFETQTAFPKWLEITLSLNDDQKQWRVINCGGISYASYRLFPIFREVVNYEPDLIILCTGHNEFLESRTYLSVRDETSIANIADRSLSVSKSYQLIRSLISQPLKQTEHSFDQAGTRNKPITKLDFENGLSKFSRDAEWQSQVEKHFEFTVLQMVELADSQQVPLLLVAPASNIRDCPPFKSAIDPALGASQTTAFAVQHQQLSTAEDTTEKKQGLINLCEIDSSYASAQFALGQIYLGESDLQAARKCFLQARDADVAPLRMTSNLIATMNFIAAETQTPCLRLDALFESESRFGINGDDWFLDHVHPNVKGHQLIASLLFSWMVEQGMARRSTDSENSLDTAFRSQIESLDFGYFQRGQDRLKSVLRWSRGKAILPAKK